MCLVIIEQTKKVIQIADRISVYVYVCDLGFMWVLTSMD